MFRDVFRRAVPKFGCGAVLLCAIGLAHASLFSDDEARKQVAEQRARADLLEARLAKVEETMKSQSLLDLFTSIEDLKIEISKLRGDIETINNNLDGAAKRQRDMYLDLDTRLRRLEPAVPGATPTAGIPGIAVIPGAGQTAGTSSVITPGAPTVSAAPAAPSGEDAAYEAAQSQRRGGNYAAAIAGFQSFIKQYPKSGLAPRAQYWIGDSYYNMHDFKQSITSQQTLIKTYPDSPSVPDAMLNIATAQGDLGEPAAARKTLQEIVARYPVSDAGEKAKRRLETPNVSAASNKPQ